MLTFVITTISIRPVEKRCIGSETGVKMMQRIFTATLLASVAGAGLATAAIAADATSDSEIVVTANKRSERILDVALAVTAVSGDDLNRRQLLDIQDLATQVPGLAFQRGGNGPSQRVIIRGLNSGGAGATVASVVDDVPISFSSANSNGGDFATDFDPYDLSRVEVLKGPQGSLYGATAEGGLIKYVTTAPQLDSFHAGAEVGALNLAHGDIGGSGKAFVNMPFADGKAAFRASGFYEDSPGWIGNEYRNERRTNGFRRYGGRASLLLAPTENFTLRATAIYQALKSDNFDTVEVNGYADPANPFGLLKGYNFNTYATQPSKNTSQLYYINADYDLGGAKIQSITSYGKLNTAFAVDTPLYAQIFGGLYFGRPNTTLVAHSLSKLKKFSQEFRLSSDNNAARDGHGLEWQAGVFYTKETANYTNDYQTTDITTDQPVTVPISPTTPQVFLASLDSEYQEFAGYADVTWHFSPAFDIEAGGRVFHNKQNYTQSTGGAIFSPPEFQTIGPFYSNETKATFSVAPRFHLTPDNMIYGRVASGYRPGGPNQTIPPATLPTDTPGTTPSTFGSDSTINYEIGYKGLLLDKKLSVDITGFYIDWKDIQVSTTVRRGFTGYAPTVNAGKATSKGFEWNFGLTPVRGLKLGWLGAYTDAHLSQDVPAINGIAGVQLPYVPKWTSTVSADYEWPIMDDFRANIGASYSYIGKRLTNFSFNPALASVELPHYSQVNLQAGIQNDTYSFQVYAKNVGDSRGVTSYTPGQLLLVFGPPGYAIPGSAGLIRPREIGVRLGAKF